MAKNAKGDTIANGSDHDLAVARYRLRRGPAARRVRAQGPKGRRTLDLQLIELLSANQPSPFDLELEELLTQQASVAA